MMMRKLSIAAVATLLLFVACGEGTETPARIAVEGVELAPPTLEFNEDSSNSRTLTATITPAEATNQTLGWMSSDTRVAKVEDGTVTAVGKGTATITVITDDGGHKATCAVTVEAVNHPMFGVIGFRTDKIWIVGDQMWSDVVMGSRCEKDTFDGGDPSYELNEYRVDCCQNEDYGHMFSWEAVNQYKADLCPGGWRVPTAEDFRLLDKTLNDRTDAIERGNDLASRKRYEDPYLWGGEYSGLARAGAINNRGRAGYYWSQSTTDVSLGTMLDFYNDNNYINPNDAGPRDFGLTLRCVKE